MSSFWERALARQEPAPQQPPSAPAASRPWWAGDQPIHTPQAMSAVPEVYQAPGNELAGHDLSKATHLKTEGICPECGSGNLAPTGKVTTKHGVVEATRCFDCGWPVAHSTRGMGMPSGGAADGAARQVASGGGVVNNFHPKDTRAGAIRTARDL